MNMAVNVTFTPDTIIEGSAATFRNTINTNFTSIQNVVSNLNNQVNGEITNVRDTLENAMVNIQLKETKPLNQKPGDLWFRIVD